ncbi:hypothetical protein TBLA_0C05900 [Henningerozyma blattae CBS 6284]|uniref:Vacuolar protein sorting-associated protein 35 n=1 Tax=Henningerozyma blattae (strain ATCC 34711 / CBS 6284 / DSM 70876 / NBRC 10599 / NRRL Y-10934 / UCD 77-7) TaxID=1071380 RepID=I2H1Y5_HENB6|nr:hypothetical protein TBLA_0C05900 [Tetrapisispora blattae CBS 6284]CCH60387.1 hypothetical protein TBLA_0C05900 [Tetrapisispora blattae CBS 6284]
MSYSDSLDKASRIIKKESSSIQKTVTHRNLMGALKHCSVMLTELRNPNLLPKQYYELYIMIYDTLSILLPYLVENHQKRHHLADLYELVQYAGNIVPRLYLMITVGTAYLKCDDAPGEELCKDMIEMCRGIQNPIRGLFLRYYLSQRTKGILPTPDNSIDFSCHFIITNFVEMNKLWVRLQHQGPLKERNKRSKERKELQILIGTQLVRLSHIIGDDNLTLYKDKFLPLILDQIVQCRDVISQEYLLDVICQVFPDNYHLNTLDMLLDTTLQLNPDVAIHTVVLSFVNRLNGYMDRCEAAHSQENNKKDDSFAYKKNSINVFQIFWNYLSYLNEERPDFTLNQIIPLVESILELSLRWYPKNLQNLNALYSFTVEKCNDFGPNLISEKENEVLFLNLLTLLDISEQLITTSKQKFFYLLITHCESYRHLLSLQSTNIQIKVAETLLDIFINFNPIDINPIELKDDLKHALIDSRSNFIYLESTQHLDNLLTIFIPILNLGNSKNLKLKSSSLDKQLIGDRDRNGSEIVHTISGSEEQKKLLNEIHSQSHHFHRQENDSILDIDHELPLNPLQEKIAKFSHVLMFIINSSIQKDKIIEFRNNTDNHYKDNEVIIIKLLEKEIKCLLILKNWYLKGNKNIQFTFPSVITQFWKIIRKSYILKKQNLLIEKFDYIAKLCFKHVSRCINELFNLCGSKMNDSVYKFYLTSASLADQLFLTEVSYDFFSQAFTIFEDSLSDSKTQFQALIFMCQTLQKTRSLYVDSYYEQLIVRCTLHASKLLKKQDQCRAVYLCSHLWWATEIAYLGEEDDEDDELNKDDKKLQKHDELYHEGKRVLECLQKSLRTADSIIDNIQSCELMIEILNRCLYYFIHDQEYDTHVTVKYINGLIELIKINLKTMKNEEEIEEGTSNNSKSSINDNNQNNNGNASNSVTSALFGIEETFNSLQLQDPENKDKNLVVMGLDGTFISFLKIKLAFQWKK